MFWKIEEELFADTKGCLGWQVIQFYRTFAVNLLNIFVINPLYRSLAYFPLLSLFLLHDSRRMPYKHRYLNILQVLSSVCLLFVNACNGLAAVSYMASIKEIPLIDEMITMSSIGEMIIFGVVPASLPVWFMWTQAAKRLAKKQQ